MMSVSLFPSVLLRPWVLWSLALLLLLLMLSIVAQNYGQLQRLRDLRAAIVHTEEQITSLNHLRRNLLVQVDYELSNMRLGQLQQQYLPNLQPVRQFARVDDIPYLSQFVQALSDSNLPIQSNPKE